MKFIRITGLVCIDFLLGIYYWYIQYIMHRTILDNTFCTGKMIAFCKSSRVFWIHIRTPVTERLKWFSSFCKKTGFFLKWVHFFSHVCQSFLFLFKVYCSSISIVPNFPLLLSPALPASSHRQAPLCCPCPWVIYTCSLTKPFPFFLPFSLTPLPSGHCKSVLYFHASGSILLICFVH